MLVCSTAIGPGTSFSSINGLRSSIRTGLRLRALQSIYFGIAEATKSRSRGQDETALPATPPCPFEADRSSPAFAEQLPILWRGQLKSTSSDLPAEFLAEVMQSLLTLTRQVMLCLRLLGLSWPFFSGRVATGSRLLGMVLFIGKPCPRLLVSASPLYNIDCFGRPPRRCFVVSI